MADTWNIRVRGQSYGPYSLEQLRIFVAEGRLAPHSEIALNGSSKFEYADEVPVIARLFAPEPEPAPVLASATMQTAEPAPVPTEMPASTTPSSTATASRAPLPSATGKFVTASGVELDAESISPTFGRSSDEPRTGQRGRFVIIADMKSRSITGLEEEIFNLGPAYALMPQAWLVTSDLPINAMRNQLVQKLGKLDVLFIVDATHNKAAWFNLGPESDSRIRRVWSTQSEPVKKAG
jgi:hypothetical protein